jgi:hypothetical protein
MVGELASVAKLEKLEVLEQPMTWLWYCYAIEIPAAPRASCVRAI